MTDKLKEILSLCKCSVSLEINKHRDYYQTVEEHLRDDIDTHCCPPEISDEVRGKMIESNTIVNLHFYPNTPMGFYDIYHYDLDACLDIALNMIKKLV